MTDDVPLGVIADRLEEIGHPGPAAAVRTLEFVLSLEGACNLESILDHAYVRLRDDHRPEMKESLRKAVLKLEEREKSRAKEISREVQRQLNESPLGSQTVWTNGPGPAVPYADIVSRGDRRRRRSL